MSKARELANLGNVYSDGALSNRNLIINGAMQVAQRGTSVSSPTDGTFLLDRFAVFRNGAGIVDMAQSSVAPDGFKNSLLLTVSTADTSLGSSDFGGLRYVVEGHDIAQIGFGTANAKQITLSFYVRSSVAGTYSVSFRNSAGNRYYAANYTINSADTWERKSITITADTSGTWVTDSGKGIDLRFCLWEGGYSAAPDAWGDGNIIGANNTTTSWIATTSNTFYITGVQLEVGDTATPFEHRSYGQELALCQRYFEIIGNASERTYIGGGLWYSSSRPYVGVKFKTTKRAAPSCSATTGSYSWYVAGAANTSTELNFSRLTPYSARVNEAGTFTGSASGNNATWLELGANDFISVDAEL